MRPQGASQKGMACMDLHGHEGLVTMVRPAPRMARAADVTTSDFGTESLGQAGGVRLGMCENYERVGVTLS